MVFAILLIIADAGYFAYTNGLFPFGRNASDIVTSPDSSVALHIPTGTQTTGSYIVFKRTHQQLQASTKRLEASVPSVLRWKLT